MEGTMRTAARRQTLVARAALAVIAFYVLDDAFLHPEPGVRCATTC